MHVISVLMLHSFSYLPIFREVRCNSSCQDSCWLTLLGLRFTLCLLAFLEYRHISSNSKLIGGGGRAARYFTFAHRSYWDHNTAGHICNQPVPRQDRRNSLCNYIYEGWLICLWPKVGDSSNVHACWMITQKLWCWVVFLLKMMASLQVHMVRKKIEYIIQSHPLSATHLLKLLASLAHAKAFVNEIGQSPWKQVSLTTYWYCHTGGNATCICAHSGMWQLPYVLAY